MEQAFKRLSLRHQHVLWWKRIDDLSYEEIAERLGVSLSRAELDFASTVYWLTFHVEDIQAGERPGLLVTLRRRLVDAYVRLPRLVWVWRAGTNLTYHLQTFDSGSHAGDTECREEVKLIASLGVMMELGRKAGAASNPANGSRLSRLIRNQLRGKARRSVSIKANSLS